MDRMDLSLVSLARLETQKPLIHLGTHLRAASLDPLWNSLLRPVVVTETRFDGRTTRERLVTRSRRFLGCSVGQFVGDLGGT